eukprot:scaffold115270_cov86-Phaeocystis_antarctica.AAC.1
MVHQVQKVQAKCRNSDGSLASSKSRLTSLPPGPPSSAASDTTPPHAWEEAGRYYAEAAAPRSAPPMAEQRAAPHPKWMEAGRQWFFPESVGVKR